MQLALQYTLLDIYKSVASAVLASVIISSLSAPPDRTPSEEEELIARALMLPYPIKSMKIDGNKIIIEIGEEEGGE